MLKTAISGTLEGFVDGATRLVRLGGEMQPCLWQCNRRIIIISITTITIIIAVKIIVLTKKPPAIRILKRWNFTKAVMIL